GTDLSVSFAEVARRYKSRLDTQGGIPTPVAFPGGAHVCEVEIDPDTGVVEVLSYVAVDDCGRVMNHTLVEGQLHGGIVLGIRHLDFPYSPARVWAAISSRRRDS